MKTIEGKDNISCDNCGVDLTGLVHEETHTRRGYNFCNYECLEDFYNDKIPGNEDFIIVSI